MTASVAYVELSEIMASRTGNIDPTRFPDKQFELYSIPAHDAGAPDITTGAQIGSTKQLVQDGDVLLSKIVPHIRRSWIVERQTNSQLIASGEWIVFRSNRFDPNYLRHLLISDAFHQQFMNTVAGVGGSLLRARPSFVARIRVPMPNMPEQRRIAEVLDQVDTLRDKRRKSIALLDDLAESIFLDMFEVPGSVTESMPLGSLADVSSGITKGRKVPPNTTLHPVPYLAVANVQDKRLILDGVKQIDATEMEIERYRLKTNDLLLTEGGDPDKLGRGTLWRNELDECIHQNHIFRVRLKGELTVRPTYLNWVISSRRGRRYFLRSAKQTTGIASINATQLRSFPVPIAPIATQQRFEDRIEAVAGCQRHHEAALNHLDALFASIQSRAFRGELWQDDVKNL
ncbi:restriction endonuclease subunit S [Nocardia abscessus]|uniref:restriction endonuclease subunit S n=1 Tax=Nocardia abscessus TaxID=120957 RepID=UPI002457EF27|nr:restriction endonuclease subunit S [Nocardia abscessus]